MGKEIERKYLVNQVAWHEYKAELANTSLALGIKYCQGYLPTQDETTVRLRIIGDRGYLTIKSKTIGITRSEFEYSIPVEDAQEMIDTLCLKPLIEKIRYKINHGDLIWEVDEFLGDNAGLIIAEIELKNEQQQVDLPHWIEREVNDQKYFNSSLVKYPYSQWQDHSA
ncbi:MAG: CYTH domain-containing protein [Waterburya sp.]